MEHTGKRALVLAGGGAKGSYQIGVWRALQALEWTPDIITVVPALTETIDRLIDEDAVRTSPIHFGLVMTELGSLPQRAVPH